MKFIHFGCWNENGCNILDLKTPLSYVMKSLNEYVLKNKIKFIVVAGDNNYPDYYQNKDTKINKNLNSDKFFSGFDCLPKNIKKYILFGNHDIEDKIKINDRNLNIIKKKIINKNSIYDKLIIVRLLIYNIFILLMIHHINYFLI